MTMQAGPIRPPSEAHSLLIRATVNCPWNRCTFCSAYKGERFRIRPVDDVKADILAARRTVEEMYHWADRGRMSVVDIAHLNGVIWLHEDGVRSAFLQDSDCLVMKTERLEDIVRFLYETFPELERVTSYARGKTVCRKTPQDLRRLREAGLSRLHIGLESGDDEILADVDKGAGAAEMIQAGRRAIESGFEVSEYVMPGLGGRERWQQHARHSAAVLNEINPQFIRLRTFHPAPGTPIHEKVRLGELHVHSVEGALLEVRAFIQALDVTSELVTADFAWNFYMGEIGGKLPEDREGLLAGIDRALEYWRAHGEPRRNPFLGNLNGLVI